MKEEEEVFLSSDDFISSDLGNFQNCDFDLFSIATTKWTQASSDDFLSSAIGNLQNHGSALVSIADMSDRLGLPAIVKNHANEIFEKVKDQCRKKNQNALFAACIFIAGRFNDMTRSMAELASVSNGATKWEISRVTEFIAEKLDINKIWLKHLQATDFIKRFCSNLGMDCRASIAAQEVAESYHKISTRGRSPVSVAAAVVYVIARLSCEKKMLREIKEATGVREQTIRITYKDLHPHLSTIIPKWFAKAKDLKYP